MPTTPPGFLILDDALAGAREGESLVLEGEEGRHAAKVARIGVGGQVLLTDAPGRQVLTEVTGAGRESLELRLRADPSPAVQRLPRLTLVQALATGSHDKRRWRRPPSSGSTGWCPGSHGAPSPSGAGRSCARGAPSRRTTARAADEAVPSPQVPAVEAPVTTKELLGGAEGGHTAATLSGAGPGRAGVHGCDESRG